MNVATVAVQTDAQCFHCGELCSGEPIVSSDKAFCCHGCRAVFEILSACQLDEYYSIDTTPGTRNGKLFGPERFAYLDDPATVQKLIGFRDGSLAQITFDIPQIHCASCIWLLERLEQINDGVIRSQVDFLKKRVTVRFDLSQISLRKLVELLGSIGYEPNLTVSTAERPDKTGDFKSLFLKLGVAGFCFGNIMLLSFPEYLAIGDTLEQSHTQFFGYLNLFLGIPVILYSSIDFFRSAIVGMSNRLINMDVPIALGISMLFGRSAYEILSQTGTGYMDSLAALVFFLLIGRLYQSKTYSALSFERDYKAYFPLSTTVLRGDSEISAPVTSLQVSDRIIIKNRELIPADSILIRGDAHIDYSFVTGESAPVIRNSGDLLFAGGRQVGTPLTLEVIKSPSQSYLTTLWNNAVFSNNDGKSITGLADRISKHFTLAVVSIAIIAGMYWWSADPSRAINAATAVLIISCPCALALSTPFALGTAMRHLGPAGLYLRDTSVIERMSRIKSVVFDKTGTLTSTLVKSAEYFGAELTTHQKLWISALVSSSTHPLSKSISHTLALQNTALPCVRDFVETPGSGLAGIVDGHSLRIGSHLWVADQIGSQVPDIQNNSYVHVSIDGSYMGYFVIRYTYRSGIRHMLQTLRTKYDVSVLSGDKPTERAAIQKMIGADAEIRFECAPEEKLEYISELQKRSMPAMMVGDGLNDAGALAASSVGVAVTENSSAFVPACDAIVDARALPQLDRFLHFSHNAVSVIKVSFVISFLYNAIGIAIAAQGSLSPAIAALLMPASSLSVVLFATLVTSHYARKFRSEHV